MSLACAGVAARGAAPAQPQTRPAPAAPSRLEVDEWIRQLGDYRYSARDEATAALSRLDPETLNSLLDYYRREHRHEPKLRLRYAIEQVFYRQMMAGEAGFLGIHLREFKVWDPRTGEVVPSVVADQVQPGLAADLGGMRGQDVIVDFGGQPVGALMNPAAAPRRKDDPNGAEQIVRGFTSPELLAFMNDVKQRPPGSRIPVRVLRAAGTRKVHVPPGATDARGLALTALPVSDRIFLDRAVVGLAVATVAENSWQSRAGLSPGDVIISADGQPLRSDASAEQLVTCLKTAKQDVVLEVRRLEQVSFTLTLGERPPELMNPIDWEPAQKRFATWWREMVGEASVRVRKAPVYYFAGAPKAVVSEAELLP